MSRKGEEMQKCSFKKGKSYRKALLFLILISFAAGPLAASGFSLGASAGLSMPYYSVENGVQYPLPVMIEPLGVSARITASHEVNDWFSYGGILKADYVDTRQLVYRSVSSVDIMGYATARLPIAGFMEIPISAAIGGHLEFLGAQMAYGLSIMWETGLDFYAGSTSHIIGMRVGMGARGQFLGGNASWTLTLYPVSLGYTYRF